MTDWSYFRGRIIGLNVSSVRCEINTKQLSKEEADSFRSGKAHDFNGWVEEYSETSKGISHTIPMKASFKIDGHAYRSAIALLRKNVVLDVNHRLQLLVGVFEVFQSDKAQQRTADLFSRYHR